MLTEFLEAGHYDRHLERLRRVYRERLKDPERAAAQVRLALNLIRVYAVLSAPFIPDAAASMLSAMNTLDTEWPGDMKDALTALPEGHPFSVPDVLFKKIADEEREGWQEKFAGVRG